MLELKNVNKYFNRHHRNEIHVINNTNLSFNNGLIALLGPSGSGKTTILNVVGGLDTVNSGNIYIDGKKINSILSIKRDKLRALNIGYIFQDYKLIDDLSVYDNVSLVLKMIGLKDKKEIEKRVSYVLDKVGMYRFRFRPANMLSGGQKQRVAIARAIVKNPNIILADEPTGNLDSKNSLEVMKIIKAISKDKLVILVTHEENLS
jgi:putative ABC transport system permease protein